MPPTDTLDLVIDKLVDQKSLAVVELRQHRGAFDDDRLDREHSEENEDDDDEKDVANKAQALSPDALPRLAAELYVLNIAVVVGRDGSEVVLVFLSEIEHNRLIR
jgi:hypothetical protein